MEKLFDKYVWQARIYPGFLTFLPILIAFLVWDPAFESTARPIVSAAVSAGIITLLANVARGAGKRAEQRLIAAWGGLPTTIILRYSDTTLDKGTKMRYHAALAKMLTTTKIPGADQEAADPASADQVYQTWARYLLGRTRNTKQFNLIFAENMEYGYRRNLYGLKPVGVSLSTASLAACGWKVFWLHQHRTHISALEVFAVLSCLGIIVLWITVVNQDWVWAAGKAYALRLLEAVDDLQSTVKTN